ncbi:MAG: OadG family protein [Ruminococcus sp.]|nr:OadG family protein [Ruminococcus sp.]
MDLMGKFTISASMLLTGFAIVFGVLFLLIFIIWLYGTIFSNAQNKAAQRKADKELKKQKEILKEEKTQPVSKKQPVVTQPAADNGAIPNEVVAAISAAVYTIYGSKSKVNIKSINRIISQSEWARASVLENNQPF